MISKIDEVASILFDYIEFGVFSFDVPESRSGKYHANCFFQEWKRMFERNSIGTQSKESLHDVAMDMLIEEIKTHEGR